MKRIILFALGFVFTIGSFAQKDDKTIATVNGKPISVGEFKKVYEKNLTAIDNEEGKDVAKNLDLYINYKLKVEEAYALSLDTLRTYKREVQSYKNQLTAPYLQDKTVFDQLVKDTYYRMKYEIRASHILIRLQRGFTPDDTLKAYNKISLIRQRILNGESFDKVAKETSEDPSAKTNRGDLGFFKAFGMVYDFEEVAYNTKDGEISEPFRTSFGYHILKRTGTRASLGERQVAHIMIRDTSATGKTKADNIFLELNAGKDFAELAKQYSEDRNSKNKGGVLQKFGTGKMVKSFEQAAFSLKKVGDYSEPIKTRFGWHIIKFMKDFPMGSFEDMEDFVIDRVRRSGRAKISDKAVLDRLKKEYKVEVVESAKDFMKKPTFRRMSKDSLQQTLLKINEKEISQYEFSRFADNRRQYPANVLLDKFIDQEVLTYFKDNLKKTNPKFAETLKEYEDGLLLFELMQQKIWNKSSDSIALNTYFNKNINQYSSKELDKVRGKVMNDFQNFLEDEWVKDLRGNNEVKINNSVLKKLIKYYRKES